MRALLLVALSMLALTSGCGGTPEAEHEVVLQAQLDSTKARLDSVKKADAARIADSIQRERTLPRQLALLNDTLGINAPGGQEPGFAVRGFRLATPGDCKVSARIEVLSGGNKDVSVALFRGDDFINWKNNPQAAGQAVFSKGPQTVTSMDIPIADAGTYYLVISNRFSTVTSKRVFANANVVCVGSPVPVGATSPK